MVVLSARKQHEIQRLEENINKEKVERKTGSKVVVKKIRDLGSLSLMTV